MSELSVKTGDDFIADCETMDLSKLHDETFLVGVSQGDRNGPKIISSTIRGPFSFVEMCEQVGMMWCVELHHAKVMILEKDRNKLVHLLDENTSDYIEAHYDTIVTDLMLGGVFDTKEYTCQAGIHAASGDDDPIQAAKKERAAKEILGTGEEDDSL